ARELDEGLAALAGQFQVGPALARELLAVQALPPRSSRRWQRDAALRQRLGARYYGLSQAVAALARRGVAAPAGAGKRDTPGAGASSVAENLSSRLRGYFFLRRQLGPDYLGLLQFFLNHRRFARSARPERVGKSPAELLSGQGHAHWLELLGYRRFRRAG